MAKNFKSRGEVKMISFNLSTSVLDELDEFSKTTGMTKTKVVENAVKIYMKKMREAMDYALNTDNNNNEETVR